jgi:hypothetical protein
MSTRPKVRPALVRAVKKDPTTERGAVKVYYGTSQLKLNTRGHIDLVIQNNAELRRLDLPMATRFDLDRYNWLPWCSEFFCEPPHCNRILAGSLSEEQAARLRAKLKRRGEILEL